MEVFLEVLANPADMTRAQWILLAILAFVLLGAFYMVWRLYKVIITAKATPYVPNIGRKRLAAHNAAQGSVNVKASEQPSTPASSPESKDA